MNYKNKKNKRESWSFRKGVILFFVVMMLAMLSVMIFVNGDNNHDEIKGIGESARQDDTYDKEEKEIVKSNQTMVVVDPGHGGNDPGKVSADGIMEKDINLQIAFCLKNELEKRGMSVHMLRETDTNLADEGASNKKVSDMKKRVSIINEIDPIVLVSIHQNSYSDSKVRGPQVFYHGESKDSEEFAMVIQENLNNINTQFSRQSKSGEDYYILNKSVCPGVIVECGFLSCPEETALLVSDEYQQKIASAIADAIEETYK